MWRIQFLAGFLTKTRISLSKDAWVGIEAGFDPRHFPIEIFPRRILGNLHLWYMPQFFILFVFCCDPLITYKVKGLRSCRVTESCCFLWLILLLSGRWVSTTSSHMQRWTWFLLRNSSMQVVQHQSRLKLYFLRSHCHNRIDVFFF